MQEGREKLQLVQHRDGKAEEEGEGLTEEGVAFPHQHLIYTPEPHTHTHGLMILLNGPAAFTSTLPAVDI